MGSQGGGRSARASEMYGSGDLSRYFILTVQKKDIKHCFLLLTCIRYFNSSFGVSILSLKTSCGPVQPLDGKG